MGYTFFPPEIDSTQFSPIFNTIYVGPFIVPSKQAIVDTLYKEIYGEDMTSSPTRITSLRTTSLNSMRDHDQHDQGTFHGDEDHEESIFGFPILDTTQNVAMKNIPPSILPNFHGISAKDPDAFLTEFEILW